MTRLTPEDEERGRLLIQHLFAEIDALRAEIEQQNCSLDKQQYVIANLQAENAQLILERAALVKGLEQETDEVGTLRAEIATFRNASPSGSVLI